MAKISDTSNPSNKENPDSTGVSHTPGPWRADGTKALGTYGVWTDYPTHPGHDGAGYPSEVCSVFRSNESSFDRETRDANARLIAAAPEMLAALKLAFTEMDAMDLLGEPEDDPARQALVAVIDAIAKATGGAK